TTQYDPVEILRFATEHVMATGAESTPQNIANAITLIYREDGFVAADTKYQIDTRTGDVRFVVSEGYISDLAIQGLSPSTQKRVASYAQHIVGRSPLRQRDLERALMLSSDLAGVTITSEVADNAQELGASTLRIIGLENKQTGAAGVEVVPLRPGAAIRGFAVQEFYGVATGGDLVRVVGQATLDRGRDWSLSGVAFYRAPVSSSGTYIELLGGNTIARREFANVPTDSKLAGWNAAFVVAQPIQRDVHNFAYVMAEYEYTDARSQFLGRKLNSTTHAIRLRALRGVDLKSGGIVRAAFSVAAGIRPDTKIGNLPDGAAQFAHIRSEMGIAVPLGKSKATSLRVEWRGQWTSTRLPAVERFVLGHAPFLRGYAPAEVEGDRGWSATVEVNHSVEVADKTLFNVVPLVFASVGQTDIIRPLVTEYGDETVASAGAGIELYFAQQIRVAGWAALPLFDGPQSRAGSPAFHIGIVKGW
ncbi:MAG: ShlB/FhaC/HecB family hemolysin secretion/activation protein, partial [Sphingorhabdus sp.]